MRKLPRFRSLNANFLVIFIPLYFIFFTSLIVFIEWDSYKQSYIVLQDKLSSLSSQKASNLALPVLNSNKILIKAIVNLSIEDPDVVFIEVFNHGEELIGNSSIAPVKHGLIKSIPINISSNDSLEQVGTLVLGVTDQNIYQDLINGLEHGSYLMFLLFAAILFSFYLAGRFSGWQALHQLHNSIKNNYKSKSNQLVEWSSNDEIGEVITAYNEMQ